MLLVEKVCTVEAGICEHAAVPDVDVAAHYREVQPA